MRFPEFSQEWKFCKLKSLTKIYDGTHQTPDYKDSGIQFVSVEDIKNLSDSTKFITPEAYFKEFKNKPEFGDILMTRIGDIGTPAIVNFNEPLAYYVSLALIKPTGINNAFLKYCIESNSFQHELWRKTIHVAFPKKINKEEIGECSLWTTTEKEQEKIASLLSNIDERINTQNKIIRDLKAEFLFLLNSCFAGEKNATIGAYIKEESHRNKQNKEYPVFSVSNKRGFIPQNEQFDDREVASNDKTNYKIVSLNQFAYNPARINVGSIGLYKNETSCIISPMYNVFSVVSIDPFILELYFKSSYFINEMNKRLEGSVRMCLTIDGLKGIKFHLPSQTFLNSFSKAMDVLRRKIELEENLLSFYQTQKKYLLANLFI